MLSGWGCLFEDFCLGANAEHSAERLKGTHGLKRYILSILIVNLDVGPR